MASRTPPRSGPTRAPWITTGRGRPATAPAPARSTAEPVSRDRLQPSLLDRLLDHEPHRPLDDPGARGLTRTQLREAVLRDLSWLFNAIRPEPDARSSREDELARWRAAGHARRSVLNHGLPAFAGVTLSRLDARAFERAVAHAIETFEPRIDPSTLGVDVHIDAGGHHNTLRFVIRGHLWSRPAPLELVLAAELDVETGVARVRELRA